MTPEIARTLLAQLYPEVHPDDIATYISGPDDPADYHYLLPFRLKGIASEQELRADFEAYLGGSR